MYELKKVHFKETLSVVIPLYNKELNIESTLKQVIEYIASPDLQIIVVENGEFWSWNSGKMFNLNITNVKGNEELVMPDECSEPFVVFPSSESRNGIN